MRMNSSLDQYITEIIDSLKSMNVEQIILFGSAARNEMHIDSDIDLVVVLDEERIPKSYEEKLQMRVKVKAAMNEVNKQIAVDVIAYTSSEYHEMQKNRGSFLKELAETGKVIYEKTGQGVA